MLQTSVPREHCAGALPRHRHRAGYVCLVLAGGYEEAGDHGRFRVTAGDVVFHQPFDAHLDRFSRSGAETLNFELDGWYEPAFALARIADTDRIARLAEHDARAAREALLAGAVPVSGGENDWPDELARCIRNDPDQSLGDWARRRGFAQATISRGFKWVYGISPSSFRAQVRARRAWRSIISTHAALSVVAQESGFADQAHMTRAIGRLTGHTPAQWRKVK